MDPSDAQKVMAWPSRSWHGPAGYGMAWHGMAWYGTPPNCLAHSGLCTATPSPPARIRVASSRNESERVTSSTPSLPETPVACAGFPSACHSTLSSVRRRVSNVSQGLATPEANTIAHPPVASDGIHILQTTNLWDALQVINPWRMTDCG